MGALAFSFVDYVSCLCQQIVHAENVPKVCVFRFLNQLIELGNLWRIDLNEVRIDNVWALSLDLYFLVVQGNQE